MDAQPRHAGWSVLLSLGIGFWGLWFVATAGHAASTNVDTQVSVSLSGSRLNRNTGTFDNVASIKNTSNTPISAPLTLVITQITPTSVSFANSSGQMPTGEPFIAVPVAGGILGPGATVSNIVLKFRNPTQVPFTFVHHVFADVQAAMPIPNVVGMPQATAQAALAAANLMVGTVTTANSNTVPAGRVISQSPVAGTTVVPGSAVALVVSLGPALVPVPNVVGLAQAVAATTLSAVNLTVGTLTTTYSATILAGNVISQSPEAGMTVPPGSAVALSVSLGPAPVLVPNVVGQTQAGAATTLVAANLTMGTVTTANSSTVPLGSVVSQSPGAGTAVAPGTAVALVVSLGPALISAPNVVGLAQAVAATTLTAANLTVGIITTANSNTVPVGSVISQNPVAGTFVLPGSAVALVVSLGIADTIPPVITITAPSDRSVVNGSPIIVTGTVDDPTAMVAVNGIIAVISAGTFTAQIMLVEGLNTITAMATDIAGNMGMHSIQVTLGTTFPTVTILDPSNGSLFADTRPITVSGTVDDATVTAVVVNGVAATVFSRFFVALNVPLHAGQNTLTATATDAAGHVGTASVMVTLADTTPPVLTITSPAAASPVTTSVVTVTGTVDDASASVAVNGVPATIQGGTFTATGVPVVNEGSNTLTAIATDAAGNVGTASIMVSRDTIAPVVTITTPAAGSLVRTGQITVAGLLDDATATLALNGVAVSVTNGTWTATVPLREGQNILTALARDSAGNTGLAHSQVTLDTTPPTVMLESPRNGLQTAEATVTVAGAVNDNASGTVNDRDMTVTCNGRAAIVHNRSFMVSDLPLQQGSNTVQCLATDRAGNMTQSLAVQVTRQALVGQHIVRVAGQNQSAPIGAELSQPLVVRLVDAAGHPVGGRSVTFAVTRGSGTVKTAAAAGRLLPVVTDATGQAAVLFTLGNHAGAGNHRVTATALGFVGEVEFSATALPGVPAHILGIMGDNQLGVIGVALPFPLVVLVVDVQGNRLASIPVTFTVTQGGGSIGGAATRLVTTDENGRAETVLTLGPDAGLSNNEVTVTSTSAPGLDARFVASGLIPGRPEDTTFSGEVLDNAEVPIPGATALIKGTSLTMITDDQGRFTLLGVPVGPVVLVVDGSTSPRPERFPALEFELVTVAGHDNTVGMPIHIPALDTANAQTCGGATACTLSMAEVEGATLTVLPHAVTFHNGAREGQILFTQVHADKVPMPPPNASSFLPAWTIQPAGTHFNPPAQVAVPNTFGLPPGEQVELFQFDHDIGEFVSVGLGTVTADGATIASDPGFGITKAGWGGFTPPPQLTKVLGVVCDPQDLAAAKDQNDQALRAIAKSEVFMNAAFARVKDLNLDNLYPHALTLATTLSTSLGILKIGGVAALRAALIVAVSSPAGITAIAIATVYTLFYTDAGKIITEAGIDVGFATAELILAEIHASQARNICPGVGLASPISFADPLSLLQSLQIALHAQKSVFDAVSNSAQRLNPLMMNLLNTLTISMSASIKSTMTYQVSLAQAEVSSPIDQEVEILLDRVISEAEIFADSLKLAIDGLSALLSKIQAIIAKLRASEEIPFGRCTVTSKNKAANIRPDGSFTIDDVPADRGFIQVVGRCATSDDFFQGRSSFFRPVVNGDTNVELVHFGPSAPRLSSSRVRAAQQVLTGLGQTTQLTVTGFFADGSTQDITSPSAGTTYVSSNPNLCFVDGTGVVTPFCLPCFISGRFVGGHAICNVSAITQDVVTTVPITLDFTTDSDGDGLPDDYEVVHACLNPTVADANADPDGDGLTNIQEFRLGTDPCVADTDGDGLSDGQEVALGTDPLSPDSDGDGLLDGDEVRLGSNPLTRDSDADGLPDGVEVAICGTPFCARPGDDADGDGLSNLEEVQLGTDPRNPDTDFDGLKDGEEVVRGTNPLNRDTDGDGFPDGLEVEAGTNPLDANSRPSFPNQPPPGEAVGGTFAALNIVSPAQDSDHDGFSDLVELQAGTDPHDPTSVPNLPRLMSEALGRTFAALNIVSPAQDSDHDGFSDLVELQAGTDPHDPTSVPNLARLMSAAIGLPFSLSNTPGIQQLAHGLTALRTALQDSDGDGIPDWFEIAHGLNPYDPTDATADPDGDGLTNYEEYLHGTDPHNADTDGDGIPDGQEVRPGTDPLNPDTTPPTIIVTQPADGAMLLAGQTITIRVEAADNMTIASAHITVNGAEFPTDAATAYALTFTVPPQADTLIVRASARDSAGNVGTSPVVVAFVTPDPRTRVHGRVVDQDGNAMSGAEVSVHLNGLRGDFFVFDAPLTSLPTLDALTPDATRLVSAMNFRNPQNLLQAEGFSEELGPHFAARFTGLLRIPTAGTYTLILGADDRARLVINGTAVVDIPATGAFTEASVHLPLPVGDLPMVIEYVRERGMAELQLSSIPPGGARQIVLPAALLQDPPVFTTVTAPDGTFTMSKVPTILGDVQVSATFLAPDGAQFTGMSLLVPVVPDGSTDVGFLELRKQ